MREHKSAHKDLQTFVEKVLALHEDVRFAALFDWEGRRLAGGMKRGIPSLDPPKPPFGCLSDPARVPDSAPTG